MGILVRAVRTGYFGAQLRYPGVCGFRNVTVTVRHFRLQYTVANGSLSTGAITAYMTDNPEAAELYADNKTISGPTN